MSEHIHRDEHETKIVELYDCKIHIDKDIVPLVKAINDFKYKGKSMFKTKPSSCQEHRNRESKVGAEAYIELDLLEKEGKQIIDDIFTKVSPKLPFLQCQNLRFCEDYVRAYGLDKLYTKQGIKVINKLKGSPIIILDCSFFKGTMLTHGMSDKQEHDFFEHNRNIAIKLLTDEFKLRSN